MTKVDPKRVCDELRSIGRSAPTPEGRAVLTEQLLHNKWEGVQSCAAQVLADWCGRESVEALRTWLLGTYERENGWAIRGVAVRALARCVGAQDAPWVLDLYFVRAQGVLAKHELLPLVAALPVPSVRDRLLVESHDGDRDNRQAAMKAIGRMPFPDRQQLIEGFVEDPDPEIRWGAEMLLGRTSSTMPPP
ncbi:MAG: hypothetical protein M3Q29_15815 [Chloroflexota bacterium]|nr:hypothetical protein [Chloroflexota bacterium]